MPSISLNDPVMSPEQLKFSVLKGDLNPVNKSNDNDDVPAGMIINFLNNKISQNGKKIYLQNVLFIFHNFNQIKSC